MSDHRPEWIPDEDDIYLALSDDLDRRIGPPKEKGFLAVDELIRRAGLCAQLHELESLIVGHEGSHMVDRVKARIEEIREELG